MSAPTEKNPLAVPADIAEALALLTRIPVSAHTPRGAPAAWAWPLAGMAVALLSGAPGWLALWLGTPTTVAAGLVVAAQVALTGGLHEDGLADTADGFWGGATRERRLDIMKDSRIGSYGVTALILSLGLRWAALSHLFDADWIFAPLLAAAMLSRVAMAVVMAAMTNARGGGLSAQVGRPARETAALGAGLALAIAVMTAVHPSLVSVVWITFSVTALAAVARAKIGGQTGDVLGAAQQIAEIATLITFASLA